MRRAVVPRWAFVVGFALQLAVVLAAGVGAWLGALPPLPEGVPYFDSLLHFLLIGLVAALLDGALAFRPLPGGRPRWLRLGPAIILAIASVEELCQVLSPIRSASFIDFGADVLGILLLSWLARRLG